MMLGDITVYCSVLIFKYIYYKTRKCWCLSSYFST